MIYALGVEMSGFGMRGTYLGMSARS